MALFTTRRNSRHIFTFTLFISAFFFLQFLTAAYVLPPARFVAPLEFITGGNHFVVWLSVGTPAQRIPVLLDTGSGDLVLFNSSSTFCTSNVGMPCYNSYKSSTALVNQYRFTILDYSIGNDRESIFDSIPVDLTDLIYWNMKLSGTNTSQSIGLELNVQPLHPILSLKPQRNYNVLYPAVNQYSQVGGIFGIAPNVLSAYFQQINSLNGVWGSITRPYSNPSFAPVFAIDYSASSLYLGGISEYYRDSLVFSTSTDSSSIYYGFFISSLSLKSGSIQLLNQYSDSYPAIVDTGSTGLQLPAELFDSLISWLPIICDLPVNSDIDSSPVCWMPVDSPTPKRLPTLRFHLSGSQSSQPLYIDLTDLILPATSSPPYRIALTRYSNIKNSGLISFGTRVLKSLFVAFDWPNHRVGFANSVFQNGVYSPQSRLAERAVGLLDSVFCVGMQVHQLPLNVCLEPPCEDYYLFEYNKDSHTCSLSSSFHILIGVLIGSFLFIEFSLNEATLWISRKIQAEVPAN